MPLLTIKECRAWARVGDNAKCPKCGSKKFGLMPTDFETAKCSKCGKTWEISASELTVEEFITERRKGAAKIATAARAKGGLSLLTAVHFEAKDPAYAACLGLVGGKDAVNELKGLEEKAIKIAGSAKSMQQFQSATGKQEAYGEVILFLEGLCGNLC